MATNSQFQITEGSGKNIATHSISESTTKEIQRIELNNSSGTEIGNATTPVQVSLANSGANAIGISTTLVPSGGTLVKGTTAAITDTTSTSVISAGAGSIKTYITSILVTNSHATVGTFVKILDGASIIWEGYAAAVGGGFASHFPVPIVGSAATAVNAQPVTTGSNVIVSIAGYQI